MAARVVASLVRCVLGRIIPWASRIGQFLCVLFEVEAGGDKAIGYGPVRGIIGKVHLVVRQVTSAAVNAEIRSRDHGQVIWIRGMKQGMEVGEGRALCSQTGKILILACDLVIDIFEDDDHHAVEMARRGPGRGPGRLILLSLRRLRDLGDILV